MKYCPMIDGECKRDDCEWFNTTYRSCAVYSIADSFVFFADILQRKIKKETNEETTREKSTPTDAALAAVGLTREQYEELKNQ